MTTNGKATGMLDTSTMASESQCTASLPVAASGGNDDCRDFATLRAEFAQRGRRLTRSHRVHDGHITYAVTRWGEPRYFEHLRDAEAYLQQIGPRA